MMKDLDLITNYLKHNDESDIYPKTSIHDIIQYFIHRDSDDASTGF